MTARNVRAYQTKGLIPPPTRRGRRSVYGLEHLHRLQAIERARARGASLALIAAHLADGRALDDDLAIAWIPAGPSRHSGDNGRRAVPSVPRAEIGSLLTRLDGQRDAATQAQIDQLVEAGVFQREGRRLFTGRDLAAAMTALQHQGLPVQVALGVAQRAMIAAEPVAETVLATLRDLEGDGGPLTVRSHLTEVACSVMRHMVTDRLQS